MQTTKPKAYLLRMMGVQWKRHPCSEDAERSNKEASVKGGVRRRIP